MMVRQLVTVYQLAKALLFPMVDLMTMVCQLVKVYQLVMEIQLSFPVLVDRSSQQSSKLHFVVPYYIAEK
jgi:hypothetical protein